MKTQFRVFRVESDSEEEEFSYIIQEEDFEEEENSFSDWDQGTPVAYEGHVKGENLEEEETQGPLPWDPSDNFFSFI